MTETTDNIPLGDRMKRYEANGRYTLPRRTYTCMRLDGRAFGTYLKHSEKPFDKAFVQDMNTITELLCQEIQGVEFAYTQSDEISLLLTDFRTPQSQPWFGGRIDKMVSISACRAAIMMDRLRRQPGLPEFDCRVWSMTDPVEVANYFLWRQRDAVTNSIQMLGQHHFTQKQLHGRSCDQIQELLWAEKDVNWNDLDAGLKRGRVAVQIAEDGWCTYPAPHFAAVPDSWLAERIPPLPSLR